MKLLGGGCGACGIVATVEVSGDRQSGLSSGGTDEAEDLMIAVERFAGPVLGDFREETMLDGVPFGGAGRVVGNRESQTERVSQLSLEFGFPRTATIAIAAAGVAQNEELAGAWLAT